MIIKILSKQRIYAFLLSLGASILLFRTVQMLFFENALNILVLWVSVLLIAECLIDFACLVSSIRWLISNDELKASIPLRLGATTTILHAIRVLIYVLGRTVPWINFDVKPEQRALYITNWFWVYFAAILSILGVVGVIVIWKLRQRTKKQNILSKNV